MISRMWSLCARGSGRVSMVVLAAMLGGVLPGAHADEFVNRANAPYASLPAARRSDTLLLPAIALMDPTPAGVRQVYAAAMLPAGKSGWSEAESWAQAKPQQDVLKVLATITKEPNIRDAYAFGQPYGVEGVDFALVQKRLYTELGDPPTLAGAQFFYLKGLEALESLVQVEATRLAAAGNPSDAIDVLINWVFFCRQMADRELFTEADWGLRSMAMALERVRDVAYNDLRGPKALVVDRLHGQIDRLKIEGSYLDLDRMTFPQGNKVAAEQVIARVYIPRNGIDERTFAPTLSRLGTTEFPLRLFSETGRWRTIGDQQANWFDATEKLAGVWEDQVQRWGVRMWDRRFAVVSEQSKLDRTKFAAIDVGLPDMSVLYFRRMVARTEAVGSQTALAVVGWTRLGATRGYPTTISAVRPQWVKELMPDPFNPNREFGARPPLEYFVPIRDTPRNERETPQPYPIEVVTPDGRVLNVPLKDDSFVLYSWGSDNGKSFARRTQNTYVKVENADYLIWPPVISLERDTRLLLGEIK